MSCRERFRRACRCEAVDRPPVWLMRQAGRVLPEYRALREKHTFLELVRTPELAAEATLQPIRRFGFDAAIVFSDILVVAEALGQPYAFSDEGGLRFEWLLRHSDDVRRLDAGGVVERLGYVGQALRRAGAELGGRTALIGFAGSPWTLANFMMEGGGVREPLRARELFYGNRAMFMALCEVLTRAVTDCLQVQIDAGADAVQLFDSLGHLLPAGEFEAASGRWMQRVIAGLRGQVPVIVFSRGAHGDGAALVETGAQVVGVDWTVSLEAARRVLPATVGIQGNLDPALLNTDPETVAAETRRILSVLRGRPGHIFNLGHGVPPGARLEAIESLVYTVARFA
ncbi:MAG: uroporphyrinogen decarboxylase [Verrucomicrobia bacterium]|nr:uroporphyrinogen decarboxylase [Verrucomicrobiota bacterium]